MKWHHYYFSYIGMKHNDTRYGFSTHAFEQKLEGPDAPKMLTACTKVMIKEQLNVDSLVIMNWKYLGYFEKANKGNS